MESIPGDRAFKSSRELLRSPSGKNTSQPLTGDGRTGGRKARTLLASERRGRDDKSEPVGEAQ